MRIGFLVNQLCSEKESHTTTGLGMEAANLGHEVWFMAVGEMSYDATGKVRSRVVKPSQRHYSTLKGFVKDIDSRNSGYENGCVNDLDILVLRNDPSFDEIARPWARAAGINFGRLLQTDGVLVLNDPDVLAKALSRMYIQQFPKEVRLPTLITRNQDEIRAFAKEYKRIVIRRLDGNADDRKGFMVSKKDMPNINQMSEAITRHGYAIAHEYPEGAANGSTRLFMMNGRVLSAKGRYAAYLRRPKIDYDGFNLRTPENLEPAVVDENMVEITRLVRPKLVQDGIFLAGLDIMDGKLVDMNLFRVAGLVNAQNVTGVNFMTTIIEALERKMIANGRRSSTLTNRQKATL